MAAPVDAEAVGNAFLSYYYGMFESNRAGLVSLYQDQSMLTFMGDKFQGPQAIGQKLGALPFAGCKVTPSTTDFQPSVSGGVIVFVTGHILVSFDRVPSSIERRRRRRRRRRWAGGERESVCFRFVPLTPSSSSQ